MKMNARTIFALAAALAAGSALASKTSPETAVAFAGKAVAYIKANGIEKGFAEINSPTGQFRDGELYIFAFDMNGKQVAHGMNAKMIGRDLLEAKDAEGTPFVKNILQIGKTKGKGWTDYKWPNPVTKAVEQKSAYCEKIEKDILICTGIYK